jgi:hypothetical protein
MPHAYSNGRASFTNFCSRAGARPDRPEYQDMRVRASNRRRFIACFEQGLTIYEIHPARMSGLRPHALHGRRHLRGNMLK